MTNSIRLMSKYLHAEGVRQTAKGSTNSYWVPVWDILLETGFELTLVTLFLIKQRGCIE